MKIVISSGHGAKIAGASGYIDEHPEAVRVVDQTAVYLRAAGVEVVTYEDKTSTTQDQNLSNLVNFHNKQGPHDLDVSIHFNCSEGMTNNPIGHEVYYYSQAGFGIADTVADEVCIASGLKNRGAKQNQGLYFLKHTNETAVLVEVCFVNSRADCDIYNSKFDAICEAIAAGLSGNGIEPVPPEPDEALFHAVGTCSWFGGPDDDGVASDEGLAFIYPDDLDQFRHLFLPYQPTGTSGMARRLDTDKVFFVACRWDYTVTSKDYLRNQTRKALVRATRTGRQFYAFPADWGPHEEETGRAADLSRCLLDALGITTDDEVEVIYPAPEE